jgi:nicotinamide mononucleotide transporter
MSSLSDILKLEDRKWHIDRFTPNFIFIGILMQVIVFRITDAPRLSLISGVFGVISVVLCSNRKMAFYLFGFVQLFTYVLLCLEQNLYGEIAENAFYFVTMLIGLSHWLDNYNEDEVAVETRKLNAAQKMWTAIGTLFGTLIMFNILLLTDDTQPFMDSITTIPAFVAQILMILRYRDSWFYWLIIDIGSIIMWGIAGDWCMVVQFIFWTVNCIYGLKKW